MKITKFLFVVVFLNVNLSFAVNIDSLKLSGNKLKDTVLVDHYFDLVKYYYQMEPQPDSMLKYALLSINAAEKTQSKSRILKARRITGISYTTKKDMDMALKYYLEVLNLSKQFKIKTETASALNNLGGFYGNLNQYDEAAKYFIEAAKLQTELKDYESVVNCYNNLNVIFYSQRQFDKVLEYNKKIVSFIPKLRQDNKVAALSGLYINLSEYYIAIGKELKRTSMIDSGFMLAKESIQYSNAINALINIQSAYYVYSEYYNIQGNIDSCIYYAKKSLSEKKFLSQDKILKHYHPLIESYIKLKQFDVAKRILDTCNMYPASKTLSNQFFLLERQCLVDEGLGDFKSAYLSHVKLMDLKDSMRNLEVNKRVNELETKYQTEIKDAKIKELAQITTIDALQIRFLVISIIAIAIVLLILIVLFRQRQLKSKHQIMETELRLNRARMDPHFFFNTLTSLQTLSIENDSNTPIMISKFSKMMRRTLESTYADLISIEDETEYIVQYLQLQQMRYPNKFEYDVQVDETIDSTSVLMPSMVLQPFVENSIEHGFKAISYKGKIRISISNNHQNLHIIVADNGQFTNSEKDGKYPSRATQIVKDRLFLLEKQRKSKAFFEVMQDEELKGYKISIILPLIQQ